jgi:hypothetical protein
MTPAELGRERLRDLAFVLLLIVVIGAIGGYRVVFEHRCDERGGRISTTQAGSTLGEACVLPNGSSVGLLDL